MEAIDPIMAKRIMFSNVDAFLAHAVQLLASTGTRDNVENLGRISLVFLG